MKKAHAIVVVKSLFKNYLFTNLTNRVDDCGLLFSREMRYKKLWICITFYWHKFVKVYRNGSYFKKIAAGSLLIILLFIHSVKLLHSHSYSPVCVKHTVQVSDREIPVSESISMNSIQCISCSYHLNKDSDAQPFFHQGNIYLYRLEESVPAYQSVCKHYSFEIETRGPPSVI